MNKVYNTGKSTWRHGEITQWHPNGVTARWLLGPCPQCGSITSNYGMAFSCHSTYCPCSANMFVCSPGPIPDWWDTDIDVKLDGDAWCAIGKDFVNLQESNTGFGNTPQEAVNSLKACISA